MMKFELKKSVFFQTLSKINKSKKSLFCTILIDILFLISLYILGRIISVVGYAALTRQQSTQLLVFVIVYYLVLLFVYSLFKYIILHFVKSVFEKSKINFNILGKFYLLNIIIFVILFVVFFLLSLLASSIKESIAPFTSLLILLLYVVFSYACLNLSHTLFFEGKRLKGSLMLTIKFLGKFNKYYGVYLVILASFVVMYTLFSIFGNLLKVTVFQDYNALLQYGDTYTIVFVHAVGVIFYIAILLNRFYFYSIVKETLIK